MGGRSGGTAEGQDLPCGKRLLGRFGEGEDGRVEEARVQEGFLVAGGVGPGEISWGQMAESSGLIGTSELAGPIIKGGAYVGAVQGEGREDDAIGSRGVPDDFVSFWWMLASRGKRQVRLYMATRLKVRIEPREWPTWTILEKGRGTFGRWPRRSIIVSS